MTIELLAFTFLAYLIGSIPFGLMVGKWTKGIDIREFGSRNIGATNVFRIVGKPWGILVFMMDALKGYWAVKLNSVFGIFLPPLSLLVLGIAAILGHAFPLWLRFLGGKGVATSLGVFMAIAWKPTLISFGIWIVAFVISHIISVASLIAALCFPFTIYLVSRQTENFLWLFATSLVLAGLIFYTHRRNISRLLKGEEKRLF